MYIMRHRTSEFTSATQTRMYLSSCQFAIVAPVNAIDTITIDHAEEHSITTPHRTPVLNFSHKCALTPRRTRQTHSVHFMQTTTTNTVFYHPSFTTHLLPPTSTCFGSRARALAYRIFALNAFAPARAGENMRRASACGKLLRKLYAHITVHQLCIMHIS